MVFQASCPPGGGASTLSLGARGRTLSILGWGWCELIKGPPAERSGAVGRGRARFVGDLLGGVSIDFGGVRGAAGRGRSQIVRGRPPSGATGRGRSRSPAVGGRGRARSAAVGRHRPRSVAVGRQRPQADAIRRGPSRSCAVGPGYSRSGADGHDRPRSVTVSRRQARSGAVGSGRARSGPAGRGQASVAVGRGRSRSVAGLSGSPTGSLQIVRTPCGGGGTAEACKQGWGELSGGGRAALWRIQPFNT